MSVMRIVLHDVPKNRPISDIYQWLGNSVRELPQSHSKPATKQHYFHYLSPWFNGNFAKYSTISFFKNANYQLPSANCHLPSAIHLTNHRSGTQFATDLMIGPFWIASVDPRFQQRAPKECSNLAVGSICFPNHLKIAPIFVVLSQRLVVVMPSVHTHGFLDSAIRYLQL